VDGPPDGNALRYSVTKYCEQTSKTHSASPVTRILNARPFSHVGEWSLTTRPLLDASIANAGRIYREGGLELRQSFSTCKRSRSAYASVGPKTADFSVASNLPERCW
jgi:hypothetical protein